MSVLDSVFSMGTSAGSTIPKESNFEEDGLPSGYDEIKTVANKVFMERVERLKRLGDGVSHKNRMEMKRDPTVRFASLLKKFSILGRGWGINKKQADSKVAEFVRDSITSEFQGSFLQRLRHILSALDHGVSVTEKIWSVLDNGNVVLTDLKTREKNLNSFKVDEDKHGNIKNIYQDPNRIDIPLDKLIIFGYMNEGSSLSGVSDFEVAWDSWFRKRSIKEFWMAYLELRSKINTIAKYEGRDLDSNFANKLWGMVKNMQLGGRMVVPQGVELDTIDMGQQDANLFYKATRYFDGQISKSILVPRLMSEASGESSSAGSYALGQSHFDVFLMVLSYVRKKLEAEINKEVIKPLVDYNFNVSEYPEFQIKFFEQNDKQTLMNVIGGLIDKGVVDNSEEWIRDYMDVPKEGEDSDETNQNPSVQDMEAFREEFQELAKDMQNPLPDEEEIEN